MTIIEVRYKISESEFVQKGIRFVVEDGTDVDEIREIVVERILADLGVIMYEWRVEE